MDDKKDIKPYAKLILDKRHVVEDRAKVEKYRKIRSIIGTIVMYTTIFSVAMWMIVTSIHDNSTSAPPVANNIKGAEAYLAVGQSAQVNYIQHITTEYGSHYQIGIVNNSRVEWITFDDDNHVLYVFTTDKPNAYLIRRDNQGNLNNEKYVYDLYIPKSQSIVGGTYKYNIPKQGQKTVSTSTIYNK